MFMFLLVLWWVDLGQVPDTHPAVPPPLPQKDRGRKEDEEA